VKPILLLAANFLREHRWPVRILFVWIVLMALISADFGRGRPAPDDILGYIITQAIFICVFSAFLAADAIYNDRKTRRILLVLSKAVTRAQYLLAPVLGTGAAAVAYALIFGVCCMWLDDRAVLPRTGLWGVVLLVIAVSILAATATLFFSTWTNPYIAVAATVTLFAAPGVFHAQRHHWFVWLPGFPLLWQIVDFKIGSGWALHWNSIILALAQSALFWLMAVAIFNRRDLAVAVE
jgi:hypothetical protein